jgi:hypothetical protein
MRSIAMFDGTVRAVLLRSAGRVLGAMCATARASKRDGAQRSLLAKIRRVSPGRLGATSRIPVANTC